MREISHKELQDILKSLVRKRQRLWQMLYQMRGEFSFFAARDGFAIRLPDNVGYNSMCWYLIQLNKVIEIVTNCVVSGTVPSAMELPDETELSEWL